MLGQTSAGQPAPGAGQSLPVMRSGKLGDTIVSELHGKYFEQSYNGNLFWGTNSAAKAVSVALTTTYTGLILLNPTNSRVNLAITSFGMAVSAAEAGIATHGLITGWAATGIVTFTTSVTQGPCLISAAAKGGYGVVGDTATLTGTPVWTLATRSGFTAGALQSSTPTFIDCESSIILAPGAYAALGALTASTIFGHFQWEEIPAF